MEDQELVKKEQMVVLKKNDFSILDVQMDELMEAVKDNLGGEELNEWSLERITMPTGGCATWNIVDADGEINRESSLRGVIVHHRIARAFWRVPFGESGGGAPPDCSSNDGKTGVLLNTEDGEIRELGGNCQICPMNQWGSAPKGDGKSCKEMRLIFILFNDRVLPSVLSVPPTSIGEIKKYFTFLISRAQSYKGVITELSLKEDKNKMGITFSKIVCKVVDKLDKKSAEFMKAYANSMEDAFKAVAVPVNQKDMGDDF